MLWVQKQTHELIEQNREPQNKPTYLCQLIFDKGGKNIQLSKDNLFSKLCWENWTAASKSMKLEHSLTPHTKINSQWLKDSNTRCCCCCSATQSCPALLKPHELPGSSVCGILQASIVEWVAISFSRGSFQPRDQTWVSCLAGGFFTDLPGNPKHKI